MLKSILKNNKHPSVPFGQPRGPQQARPSSGCLLPGPQDLRPWAALQAAALGVSVAGGRGPRGGWRLPSPRLHRDAEHVRRSSGAGTPSDILHFKVSARKKGTQSFCAGRDRVRVHFHSGLQPWRQEPRAEACSLPLRLCRSRFLLTASRESRLYLEALAQGRGLASMVWGRLPSAAVDPGGEGTGAPHRLPVLLNRGLGFDPGSWLDRWEWTECQLLPDV